MANTYYRGQGKLWIASRDSTGRTSGFVEIGDAEALNVNQSESYDDVFESQSGSRVKVVHSAIEYNMDFELTVLNFSAENLARATLGSATLSVAGGSVTNESHKAWKGSSVFLKYPGVSAVTVTGAGGSPSYSAGTDYVVNATEGRIDFPAGSSIVNGAELHIDYTHGGVDAVMEAVTQTANREYVIIFEGKNMNQQGTPVIVRLHRAYMNVSQALALLNTQTARFTLSGSLLPAPEITTAGLSQFMNVTVKDLA